MDHGRISSVMAHPPNPRSRDIFIPPAMPSLIQNPERQYQAQQILMSLDASHANARALNPTGIIAKSKVRGVQNTDPTLEFKKLSKLIIAQVGDVDLNTNTRINAMTHFANESDPVWDAIETLLLSVNRHLMKRHGFMVTRDQITVIYTNSGTEVPEHLVEGDTSVGQLWAASRGTLLSKRTVPTAS
ncbi:hypothetical protein HMN09_01050800 [Mycena chlorophos]|uniref:Uncharacterized protein n=1 Tax=Mycena chlorophos TaxID=658473 RepID=A0A8H6SGK3_MYCCL|nr:hypothetical protein HMN09_01050800 [Mycena chlorophos]